MNSAEEIVYDEGRTCKNCLHSHVCALFRAITPLISDFPEAPFKSEDLAKICVAYMEKVVMETVTA